MKRRVMGAAAAAMAAIMTAGALALPVPAAEPSAVRAGAGYSAVAMESERSDRELTAQTMNSNYLLPDSDTYYITEADISWMDDTDLMLARNEFYARRGRKFVTKSIREYFERQGWYKGTIEPDDFSNELFNRYEQANVDFIVAYEKKRQENKKKKKETITMLESIGPSTEEEEEYTGITSLYADSIREDWSDEELDQYGINSLTGEVEGPEGAGYLYLDLDGDGSEELLIGPTDTQIYGAGALFAIYTMEDGIPVLVAESTEEGMYYLCEDNVIRREAFYEDGRWEIAYYDFENGELVYRELLIMDEERNMKKPWFIVSNAGEIWADADPEYTGLDWIPDGEYKHIDEKKASELRASYASEPLEFLPMD